MSDIRIDKSREIAYNEFGQAVKSEEAHIKILASFKNGALQVLKGARLHVFICIALHEAEDKPGASLNTISRETGYDRSTIITAIRFLEDNSHRFIDRDGQEEDGTNIYRPAAYAWFGKDKRNMRSSIPPAAESDRASSIRQKDSFSSGSGSRKIPPGGSRKIPLPPSGKFPAPVVDVDCTSNNIAENQQQTTNTAAARKIFASVRIGAKPLRLLSQTVAPALAARWARWIAWAEEYAGADYSNPRGLAVYLLSEDPAAEPPDDVPEAAEAPEPEPVHGGVYEVPPYAQTCEGILNSANEVWHAVVGELKQQMTRASFDTWVRPTRVLGYEDDALVVRVASEYAKEWLENRLAVTVERMLGGVAGRALAIRYEAGPQRPPETASQTLGVGPQLLQTTPTTLEAEANDNSA